MAAATLPDLDQLDPNAEGPDLLASETAHYAAREILSQREQLASRDAEIEHLKLLIAKLRRLQFGRSSEKLDRQIEQLELQLEELQASQAENNARCKRLLWRRRWKGRNRHGDRYPNTCRGKCGSICRSRKLVRTVAAS